MPSRQQSSIVLNGMADALVLWFFLYGLWLGLTSNPEVLVIVVPALGVLLFFRFRMMRARWKV